MLGFTCVIHLGIQWPRIQFSIAYAQHQHGRPQGLCPTIPIIFSCLLELLAQHKTSIYPCALELLTQHKTSHQPCASGSTPNTNKHIYIICNWLTPTISNKSSCSYAMWSSTQYIKTKNQGNIITNGLMPISVRSKIWDITYRKM